MVLAAIADTRQGRERTRRRISAAIVESVEKKVRFQRFSPNFQKIRDLNFCLAFILSYLQVELVSMFGSDPGSHDW